MLEAKNLVRQYRPKDGVVVNALDDVSITFEETGMVFILGKSGSGKSTLLNVLGGLDKYDSGEIIVKGKSSKNFSQADFDSYRNTFIGFIFQEYNILNDFTVEQNIALALELQGKKPDKKLINELIEKVDLAGYGKRKPNTLSGGQKQRVAIARALVKNPEIIMADEPTGALDSNTGKQVLDTLKKLSKEKLVIIVSHDREFAEYYGDRIIEIGDGKVLSDNIKFRSEPKVSDGFEIVDDKVLTIKKGTVLDAAKLKTLNSFLSKQKDDVIISVDNKANAEFKKFAKIDEDGNKESFRDTVPEDVKVKEYGEKDCKLIRSKLPFKDAFKMGASSLKTKTVRLIFTILLSSIAFALFGLADTLGSYDKITNSVKSIEDAKVNYSSITKEVEIEEDWGTYYNNSYHLTEEEVDELNDRLGGAKYMPVFSLNEWGSGTSFGNNLFTSSKISYDGMYSSEFFGFMEAEESDLQLFGNLIDGRAPAADNEIVITEYVAKSFVTANYRNPDDSDTEVEINNVSDMIGKKIAIENNKRFEIVGILNTNFDYERYKALDKTDQSNTATITDWVLQSELSRLKQTSPHALCYVNKGYLSNNAVSSKYERVVNNAPYVYIGNDENKNNGELRFSKYFESNSYVYTGEVKTSLTGNEVIVAVAPSYLANNFYLDYSSVYLTEDQYKRINVGGYIERDLLRTSFVDDFIVNHPAYTELNDMLQEYKNWNTSAISPLLNWYAAVDEDFVYTGNVAWSGTQGTLSSDLQAQFEELLNEMSVETNGRISFSKTYKYLKEEMTAKFEQGLLEYEKPTEPKNYVYFLINGMNGWNDMSAYSKTDYELIDEIGRFTLETVKDYLPTKMTSRYEDNKELEIVAYYCEGGITGYNSYFGIISDSVYDDYIKYASGPYVFAIAPLDYNNKDLVKELIEMHYTDDTISFRLNNPVMSTLDQFNDLIETLSKVFLYVGLGFAVFAALLLLNFISISISYKKREIGVLRAIGARGMDVFKIFFNEAFIIAFINFVIAFIGAVATCIILNKVFANEFGLLVTLLNIGIRQALLMFAVSLFVAIISSSLPVAKIAKKKPIDAIRTA